MPCLLILWKVHNATQRRFDLLMPQMHEHTSPGAANPLTLFGSWAAVDVVPMYSLFVCR